jgi:hypothetical protein
MGSHLVVIAGVPTFQSDKYATCPPGKVPLSVKDPDAQDLLAQYAERHRSRDAEFTDDLDTALRHAGYDGDRPWLWRAWSGDRERICDCGIVWAPTVEEARKLAWMILGGPHAHEVRSIDAESIVRKPPTDEVYEGQAT